MESSPGEEPKRPSDPWEGETLCKCGQYPIQFFMIGESKSLCDKCTVNEIYKNEPYDKVMPKVWNKVNNIMKIRKRLQLALTVKKSKELLPFGKDQEGDK